MKVFHVRRELLETFKNRPDARQPRVSDRSVLGLYVRIANERQRSRWVVIRGFLFLVLFCFWLSAWAWAGEYDAEIAEYQQKVAQDPTDQDAAYQLGNFLAWEERYDEAIQIYQAILAIDPEYEEATIGMARVLSWKGEQEAAKALYEAILIKNPKSFEAYQGLGSLSLWVNDFEQSIGYFRKALKINSEDVTSLNGIGRAYLGKGDRRRAEEYFTRAEIVEFKKTPWPVRLAIFGGFGLLVFTLFLLFRSRAISRKKVLLKQEIKIIRYAIYLHHERTGKFPLALEKLLEDKWFPAGAKEEIPYLEGIGVGDRGLLVDIFGNRYWYNADTGGVYSITKGCEQW